ncbi:MGMT family protein [Haloferax namakaokahaiae]|uniref:MGMT family protein n=1 Tax=Haloferax namakaokahaiae TaxID=1748331 RepID=A0ABD5ZGN4_9EURY
MDVAGIYASELPSVGRAVQIGVVSGKLISVTFPESVPDDAEGDHPILDDIVAAIDGEEVDFSSVEIGLTVPTDQRSVLEALRNVPRGKPVEVGLLVRMAGLDPEDDASARTVTRTLSNNPIPVVVPDHRVMDGPSAAPDEVVQALRRAEGL